MIAPTASAPGGLPEWPIVERDALLAEVVARLTRSPARGAYLVGAAGAGKTVLARQAAARLEGRETVTVLGMAELGSVPLGAWAPVLAARGLPADPEGAVAALMAHLGARPHGIVLVVDDAPRLDDMSAAVVYQLVRGFGLPVVATARLGETPHAPIQRLLDEGLVDPVAVGGLDEDEVARVLELRFGQMVRHGDVVRVHARTEGNPLYIRALVEQAAQSGRARVENGAVTIEDGRTPPALLEVVAQRIDALDGAAREALHLIAVSQPLRPEQLASGAIAPAVLDDLEIAGLVVFHADAGVSVAHPLIAEALARATDAAEVRHRAIGLLRAGHAEATRFAACRLEREAGLLDPAEAAWAAEYAFASGDHGAAAAFAEAAAAGGDGASAFRGWIVLGSLASQDGRFHDADAAFASAEERAAAPHEWARLAAHRGEHLAFRVFDVSAAIDQAERIRELLPPEFTAGADANVRLWRAIRGETYMEATGAEPATELPPDVAVRGAMAAIMHESMAGRVEAGSDAEHVLVRAGEQLGRLDAAASTMVGFTEYIRLLSRGEGERAAEVASQRRVNAGDGVGLWTCTLAEHRNYNGRLAEAARLSALAADQLRWRDGLGVLPLAVAIQADVAAKQGRTDHAHALLASLTSEQRQEPKAMMVAAEAEAWLMAEAGDVHGAARLVEECALAAIDVGFRLVAAISLGLCVRLGMPGRAAAILEEICADVPADFGLYTSLRDVAVALRDKRPQDVPAPAAALAAAGMPPTALDAILLAGRMSPTGETARRLDRVAAVWAPTIDAPLLHRREGALLTPRELEVARLAADRQRTREIAETLGVSQSTVNNQLQSVYRKLGVASRDELRDVLEEWAGSL